MLPLTPPRLTPYVVLRLAGPGIEDAEVERMAVGHQSVAHG